MSPEKLPVWFTRPLSGDEVRSAREQGIEPVVHPLISIEFEPASVIIEKTQQLPGPDALLFTSRNAVDAFLACRVMKPNWLDKIPVYSVGERTAGRLAEAGIEAKFPEKNQDGNAAANLLSEELGPGSEVWHFAAKEPRPEAAEICKANRIGYHAITAYTTHQLEKAGLPGEPFHAVAFYSPSAVRAFVASGDKLPEGTRVVAAGATTAAELESHGITGGGIADLPSTAHILVWLNRELR